MRKTTFILFVASLAIAMLFCVVRLYSKESKEQHPIPLRHVLSGGAQNPESPRSLSIEVYYNSDLFYVSAYINGAGNTVDVFINNCDTDEEIHYQISGNGSSFMPISGSSGYWTITFVLSNGDEYIGEFYL